MLSKEKSSNSFKVFGMTRPGIETRSPGSLANTLLTSLEELNAKMSHRNLLPYNKIY